MTQVIFYSLAEDDSDGHQLVCQLSAALYGGKQRVSVWCKNQTQAESLDELLWQAPADRFIPHNLKGEGPRGGAPVEICWDEQSVRLGQHVLVTSALTLSEPSRFQQIIDFVPTDEVARQAARERYKYYQRMGCQMQFAQAPAAES